MGVIVKTEVLNNNQKEECIIGRLLKIDTKLEEIEIWSTIVTCASNDSARKEDKANFIEFFYPQQI